VAGDDSGTSPFVGLFGTVMGVVMPFTDWHGRSGNAAGSRAGHQ